MRWPANRALFRRFSDISPANSQKGSPASRRHLGPAQRCPPGLGKLALARPFPAKSLASSTPLFRNLSLSLTSYKVRFHAFDNLINVRPYGGPQPGL
jgi:hypothetical protein